MESRSTRTSLPEVMGEIHPPPDTTRISSPSSRPSQIIPVKSPTHLSRSEALTRHDQSPSKLNPPRIFRGSNIGRYRPMNPNKLPSSHPTDSSLTETHCEKKSTTMKCHRKTHIGEKVMSTYSSRPTGDSSDLVHAS